MKIINVALNVKPGIQTEYETFITKLVAGSRNEAGNVSYDHFKAVDSDTRYEIIEHWQDQAAVDFHNKTPHFQEFLAHVNDYLTEAPTILRLEN